MTRTAPPPVTLRRQTPNYAFAPAHGKGVHGTCEWCGWETRTFNNGALASIFAEHGLADGAHITGTVPVCSAVML